MKEGKIEKPQIDEIKRFLGEIIEKSKNDLNPSPLRLVERKYLIPEVEEAFLLFKNNELEAARAQMGVAKEKIGGIKNREKRESNDIFIQFFDHEIDKAIETKQTREFNAQDNL